MIVLPAEKRENGKMYCKSFISVDTEEYFYSSAPSQICTSVTNKIIYGIFCYYFYSRQRFSLEELTFLFQKKRGMSSCNVFRIKETKIKPKHYNQYFRYFTKAAKRLLLLLYSSKPEQVCSLIAYSIYLSFVFICWIKSENGSILLKKRKV